MSSEFEEAYQPMLIATNTYPEIGPGVVAIILAEFSVIVAIVVVAHVKEVLALALFANSLGATIHGELTLTTTFNFRPATYEHSTSLLF